MRPGEGLEDLEDEAAAGVDEVVDDWEAEDVVALAVDRRVVGVDVGVGVLFGALDVGTFDCDVVLAPGAMLGRLMLGMAVGMETAVWLERKDATTPPTLLRMLFICRRCWRYLC